MFHAKKDRASNANAHLVHLQAPTHKPMLQLAKEPNFCRRTVRGARQVGKTWLLKEFGRTSYAKFVYVNFEETPALQNIFAADFDIERIITYSSNKRKFEVQFNHEFKINGEMINTLYPRYDSPYVQAGNKPKTIEFRHNGKSLFLDFKNMKREMQ